MIKILSIFNNVLYSGDLKIRYKNVKLVWKVDRQHISSTQNFSVVEATNHCVNNMKYIQNHYQ